MTEEQDKNREEILPEEESTGFDALDRQLANPLFSGGGHSPAAQVWMAGFLIVALGFLAYTGAVWKPFHEADRAAIVENEALRYPATFPDAVVTAGMRPLAVASFAVNGWLSGWGAWAFHLVNVLLHLSNAVLLYLFCRRAFGKDNGEAIPMVAGLVFAVHPMCTESVNYIVGRDGLLALACMLGAALAFLSASDFPSERQTRRYLLALAFFVAAWTSHGVALLLPVLVLIADWMRGGAELRERKTWHGAFWFVGLALFLVSLAAWPGGAETTRADFWQVLAHGFGVTSAPGYSMVHGPIDGEGTAIGLFLFILIALTGIGALIKRVPVGLGLVLWAATVLYAASWGSGDALQPVVDRDYYLAIAGLALGSAGAIASMPMVSVRVLFGLTTTLGIVVGCLMTADRNVMWQDEVTLWQYDLAKSPNHVRVHEALGNIYVRRAKEGEVLAQRLAGFGRMEEYGETRQAIARNYQDAVVHLRRVAQSDHVDGALLFKLAYALEALERDDEALVSFLQGLEHEPRDFDALVHTGSLIHAEANGTDDIREIHRALEYFLKADAFQEMAPGFTAQFAYALTQVGDFQEALPNLEDVVEAVRGGEVVALMTRTRPRVERVAGIQRKLQTMGQAGAVTPSGQLLVAEMLLLQGRYQAASYGLEALLESDPAAEDAWLLMALVRGKMAGAEGFVSEWPPPASAESAPALWAKAARQSAVLDGWDAALVYQAKAAPERAAFVLADIATELGRHDQVMVLMRQVAEAAPNDPEPWLRMAESAIDRGDFDSAENALEAATARNADEAAVTALQLRLSATKR
jgi:tetratricopeptide (TPR) repeat protein